MVVHTLTDTELIDLMRVNDHAAFTEIYHRYWDKLYVVAYNRINDEIEAEEIIQNIFLSLWQRRQKLQLKYSLHTYLSVAIKYQVITRLAQRKRQAVHTNFLAVYTEEAIETTAQWLSEKELKSQLEQTIQLLPKKCKIVFELSREQDMTNAQIAKQLGISEKTVEGHITKALHVLRKSFNLSVPVILYLLKK